MTFLLALLVFLAHSPAAPAPVPAAAVSCPPGRLVPGCVPVRVPWVHPPRAGVTSCPPGRWVPGCVPVRVPWVHPPRLLP